MRHLLIIALLLTCCALATAQTITVTPATTFQTFTGWEATAQSGQTDFPAAWPNYKENLLNQAVDLGINRLRIEISTHRENTNCASTSTQVNDNADPNVINWAGFCFSDIDDQVREVAIPLRDRLRKQGEDLYIDLCYVDFRPSLTLHEGAAEYAELMLATTLHLQQTFGVVPNAWEIILEPDNGNNIAAWTATVIANTANALGTKLTANGFTPRFILPSTTNMTNAGFTGDGTSYYDSAKTAGLTLANVESFSYHRYVANDGTLGSTIAQAIADGKTTGMNECANSCGPGGLGADYTTLYTDLTTGKNSFWQQFALAYPDQPDNGSQYFIPNSSTFTVAIGARTKLLRQYFKFIRRGAVRYDATSNNGSFRATAWKHNHWGNTVVVNADTSGTVTVAGLPAGTYHVKYSTAAAYNVDLADATITTGQSIVRAIPAAGVMTLYQAAPSTTPTCDFYVSPAGTSGGTGAIGSPWDLQTALNQPGAVGPGAVICLRGSIPPASISNYTGRFVSSLTGAVGNPITVQSYPGEWVRIDGNKVTTLTAAMNASQSTIALANTSGIPLAAVLKIDNELMQVNGVNPIQVVRGWSGSTPAAHSNGASVFANASATMVVNGSDVTFRDMEIMDSNPNRVFTTAAAATIHTAEGVYVFGPRTTLINLVVHDTQDGIVKSESATGSFTAYGVVSYNNGYVGPYNTDINCRGNGHGFYIQNNTGTTLIGDGVSFNNYATGGKGFGEAAHVNNITFQGMVSFNNSSPAAFSGNPCGYATSHRFVGLHFGSGSLAINNDTMDSNYLYQSPGTSVEEGNLKIGYVSRGGTNVNVTNNYIMGGDLATGWVGVQTGSFTGNTVYSQDIAATMENDSGWSLSWNTNTYFNTKAAQGGFVYPFGSDNASGTQCLNALGGGFLRFTDTVGNAGWKQCNGFDAAATYTQTAPTVNVTAIRANGYTTGRANVVIYNWQGLTSVNVNLSTTGLTNGTAYEIRSAENPLGAPIATGTYSSGSPTVSVPMTGNTVATPIGAPFTPASVRPQFGAFIVIPAGIWPSGSAPPPVFTWQKSGVSSQPDKVTTLALAGTRLWAGTDDNGVYFSDNNGTTWTQQNTGFGSLPTYTANLIISSAGTPLISARLAGVTQLWRFSGGSWSAIAGTTSFYAGDQVQLLNGTILRCSEYVILQSTDDGASFSVLNNTYFASSGGGSGYGSPAVYSLYQAPNGTVYAGTEHDGVHFSLDNGATWAWLGVKEVNPGQIFPFGNVSPMKVNNGGQLVVATGQGGMFVHTGAVSPVTCTSPPACTCLPTCGGWNYSSTYPSTVSAVENTTHDVFLLPSAGMYGHGARIYGSLDSAATWGLDDSGIPAGTLNNEDAGGTASLFHHTMVTGADGKVYLGIPTTGFGVYRTVASFTPPSTTWYVRNDGGTTGQCNGHTNVALAGSSGGNCAYSNPQDAITAAACGDTIRALAGNTFDGTFTLPNKSCSISTPVTITSTASLPSRRVAPADATLMPRFRTVSSTGDGVFVIAASAGWWVLDGLELTDNAGTNTINMLVDFQASGTHDLTMTRCYLHQKETGTNYQRSVVRAMEFEGTGLTYTRNYVFIIGHSYSTTEPYNSEGLLAVASPGTILMEDNYISVWYNGIFLGGGDTAPQHTATLTSATTTSATFSSVTGLVTGAFIRFSVTGTATLSNAGSSPTLTRITGDPWVTNDGNTNNNWGDSALLVSQVDASTGITRLMTLTGNNVFTTTGATSSVAAIPNGGVAYTIYQTAKVTGIAGNVVTYDPLGTTNGIAYNINSLNHTGAVAADWNQGDEGRIVDVTVRQNTFYVDPAFAAYLSSIGRGCPKGAFEIKNADRFLFTGNYVLGFPAVLAATAANQNGTAPWITFNHATISSNWIAPDTGYPDCTRSAILFADDAYLNTITPTSAITITNNLIVGGVREFATFKNGDLWTVTHNTVLNGAPTTVAVNGLMDTQALTIPQLVFTDNIGHVVCYGFQGYPSAYTSRTITNNVLVDADASCSGGITTSTFGAGSGLPPIPTADSQIGFTNLGAQIYSLAAGSNYKAQGTGGSDPGINYATLIAALGGAAPPNTGPAVIMGKATIKGKVTVH